MEEILQKITLSGVEYPMKCSNFVLAQVQNKYGSLAEFELKLTGKEIKRNKDGEIAIKDGKKQIKLVEPSVDAVNFFLPLCINEGIEIEAEERGEAAKTVPTKKIIRQIDINHFELATICVKEFYKAITPKK